MSLDPKETKTKAKIVVIVDWVLLTITSGLFIAYVITACVAKESLYDVLEYVSGINVTEILAHPQFSGRENQILVKEEIERNFWHTVMISVGVVWTVGTVITLALNILLTVGVHRGDRHKCNIWLTIQIIIFVLGVLGLISQLIETFQGTSGFPSLFMNFITMTWLWFSIMIIRQHRDALGGGRVCGCC